PPLVGTPPRRRGRRRGCRGLGRIEPSKGLHQPPRGGGTGSAFTAALVAVDPASGRDRRVHRCVQERASRGGYPRGVPPPRTRPPQPRGSARHHVHRPHLCLEGQERRIAHRCPPPHR